MAMTSRYPFMSLVAAISGSSSHVSRASLPAIFTPSTPRLVISSPMLMTVGTPCRLTSSWSVRMTLMYFCWKRRLSTLP